jgi:hypothetical protein
MKLKSHTTIMQAAQLLVLMLKPSGNQQRGPCPVCNSGGDRALLITPERGLFYCFPAKSGGDLIKLAARAKDWSQKEAAQLTQSQIRGTVPTVPARAPGIVGTVPPHLPRTRRRDSTRSPASKQSVRQSKPWVSRQARRSCKSFTSGTIIKSRGW